MFIPFIGRHCRSLVLSFLLMVAGSASAIAPTAHADGDAGACASLLAFPKPPPVPLSFPKPPPVPLGGISGTVSPSAAAVTVSLYRCSGPDAVLVEQAVSGSGGAFAFTDLNAADDYYVEVPGTTTRGAYALPGMSDIHLQAP